MMALIVRKYLLLLLLILLFLLFSCQKQSDQSDLASAYKPVFIEASHKSGILDILPLPGHRLLSVGRDSMLILWQTDSARALVAKKLTDVPQRLSWLPDKPHFWVVLKNGQALEISLQKLKIKTTLKLPQTGISQLAVFPAQKAIYLKGNANLMLLKTETKNAEILPFTLNKRDGFAIHSLQPMLALFRQNNVQLFDLRNFKRIVLLNLTGLKNNVTDQRLLTFINGHLCVAAFNVNLWLIDWNTKTAKRLPKSHLAPITAITASQALNTAVSGAMDKSIKIWDLNKRELRASLYGHFFNITQLTVVDSINQLISASEDGTILIYDLKSFEILRRLGAIENALKSPWKLKIFSVRPVRSFKVGENEYNVSKNGSQLLKVNAEIKNVSKAEAMFFSSNFFVIDPSDSRSPMVGLENYVALDPDAYFKKKIAPGQSLKGNFVFIVKPPYKNYRITYETLPPISLDKF